VIDVEFDREGHGSIPATATGRGLEPLDAELTANQIQLVVKTNQKKKVNHLFKEFKFLTTFINLWLLSRI
jgi:hypothetical protein